jgi:hypothetical protein
MYRDSVGAEVLDYLTGGVDILGVFVLVCWNWCHMYVQHGGT